MNVAIVKQMLQLLSKQLVSTMGIFCQIAKVNASLQQKKMQIAVMWLWDVVNGHSCGLVAKHSKCDHVTVGVVAAGTANLGYKDLCGGGEVLLYYQIVAK